MSQKSDFILSTVYLGPIEYFAHLLRAKKIIVENQEHYIKQTYRNRCLIVSSSGVQPLIIPVKKINGNHTVIKDIKPSYTEKWQYLHWKAITASYNHSPYFLYYKDELEEVFTNKYDLLFEFNHKLLKLILDFLGLEKNINLTERYQQKFSDNTTDLRNAFSPKIKSEYNFPEYTQVFSDSLGFIPNLSIIDLLFNLGPESVDYLMNLNID